MKTETAEKERDYGGKGWENGGKGRTPRIQPSIWLRTSRGTFVLRLLLLTEGASIRTYVGVKSVEGNHNFESQ